MPKSHRAIRTMWRFQAKSDSDGRITRFRPRFVALGNYQTPGVDYHETFSPFARMASFRVLLGLAAKLLLKVYAGDFTTAYLNAELKIKQYASSVP